MRPGPSPRRLRRLLRLLLLPPLLRLPRRPRRPPDRWDLAAMSAPSPLLRVDLLTLFPGLFDGFLDESILKRAIARGLVEVHRHDIRDWAEGKHSQVDDRPFG